LISFSLLHFFVSLSLLSLYLHFVSVVSWFFCLLSERTNERNERDRLSLPIERTNERTRSALSPSNERMN
jgi:hypothetical protein